MSRDSHQLPHAIATGGITTTEGQPQQQCTDASPTPEVHAATGSTIVSNTSTSQIARPTTRRRGPPENHFPLSEHFNAPIRPHVWYSKRRAWTRSQLDRERQEFFETRVTGRSEIWAALAAALSFMRESDIATAQSIIDAAGITVPTGDVCQGCYDEQGALYRLPQCIVSDPENLVQADRADDYSDVDDDDMSKFADDDASGDELISDDPEKRRDEKGKTSERDLISVRARLSDRDGLDLVMSVEKNRSVGFIARKIRQEADVCSSFLCFQ